MAHDKRMDFTDWASGEPNNADGDENCVDLSHENGFKWNDNSCDVEHRFVCEEDVLQSKTFE